MKLIDPVQFSIDEPNFPLLFHRFNPHAKAIALRICGNTAAAEDAVQDAWLRAYTHFYQLKNQGLFLPWFKRIVANSCYQILRKENHLQLMPVIPESDRMIEENIERKLELIGLNEQLYAVLANLPLSLRQTVMLRYLSDTPSYEQIAAITGVPVGTVRSRLSDSKKKLASLWTSSQDPSPFFSESSNYWNQFYKTTCPGIYNHLDLRSEFLKHVDPQIKIFLTSGKILCGQRIFEQSLVDDIKHGSRLATVDECSSSGDLTVLKVSFENSKEYPSHCPTDSYFTFIRNRETMMEMRFYHGKRECIVDNDFS